MLIPAMPVPIPSMELRDTRFRAYNVPSDFEESENIADYFSLTAPPNTNVARRPPQADQANAPMILTKVGSFVLAEVTISADFEMDWDQGGLIIFAGCPPGYHSSPHQLRQRPVGLTQRHAVHSGSKWAKVGLEFTGGEFGISSVVANPDCGADWSFTPAFPSLTPQEAFSMAMPSLRVKLERVGSDLWVWYKVPESPATAMMSQSPETMSRNWRKSREIMGFFDGVAPKAGVWVGCYASRPVDLEDANEEDGLFVEFEDFEIM